jgi:hypothetical protein
VPVSAAGAVAIAHEYLLLSWGESDYETNVIARPARGPRPACGDAPDTSRVAKFEMMHGEAL